MPARRMITAYSTAISLARLQIATAQGRRSQTKGRRATMLTTMIKTMRLIAKHDIRRPEFTTWPAVRRCYAIAVAEILIAILIIGVLFISDPDRLQRVIDRLREFSAWLAE